MPGPADAMARVSHRSPADRPPTGSEPQWLGRRRQAGLLVLGLLLLVTGIALTLHNGSEPTAIVAGSIALIAIGLLGHLVDEVAVGPVTARRRRVALGDMAAEAQAADPAIGKAVEKVAEIAQARTPRQLDAASAAARAQLLAHRAEEWVMDLERAAGRTPRRPGPTEVAADVISPPRRIRVRFIAARPTTAQDLVVEGEERSLSHLYLVEGADPADPSLWRLRVVTLPSAQAVGEAERSGAATLAAAPPLTPDAALQGPLRES